GRCSEPGEDARVRRSTLRVARLEKLDVIEHLVPALVRECLQLSENSVAQVLVHSALLYLVSALGSARSSLPTRPASPSVDVNVRRVVCRARVQPQTADEIGMFVLDLIHRANHKSLITRGDAPIAVGVDRQVGRVAVLMYAVARRPPYP